MSDDVRVTPLQLRALEIIRKQPGISGQLLTYALGVKRTCGVEMKPQGAGAWGVRYAKALEKLGLVHIDLIGDRYRSGFYLTRAADDVLADRERFAERSGARP